MQAYNLKKLNFIVLSIVITLNVSMGYAIDKASMLKNTLTSMVTIYSVANKNSDELDLFFKSSLASGSTGSGVIVDKSGLIITNKHVILPNSSIKAVLYDGRVYKINVIKLDESLDLALLQIENTKNDVFDAIKIVASDKIAIGDDIFAIGNPFGVGISVTSGIVSALPNNNLVTSKIGNLIQTDAVMNPGNSGGALINQSGELIGINMSILTNTGTFSGISFAIPSNVVKLFLDRTLNGKKVKQYWFGMSAVNVNNELAMQYGLTRAQGVIITTIFKGGPADKAGLKVGDIILAVGDKKIMSLNDLVYLSASLDSAQSLWFEILSMGEIIRREVRAETPEYNIKPNITTINKGIFSGITVANNSHALSYELGISYLENTLVIYDIDKKNILEKLGIKKSDIIFSLNGIRVLSVDDFIKKINQQEDNMDYNMVIKRQNNDITLNLRKK